ncbi:MAG: hypothetical protein QXE81_01470 [Desulfurococcaceae archaeon]
MSTLIKEYMNVGEFLKTLDDTISEYRRTLGELLRKIEELRIKSDQETKLRSILSKIGATPSTASNEINLKNVRILVNPLPQQELTSLESAVEVLNNKIALLTGIRKDLEVLTGIGDVGIRIIVVYVDDIPKNIMLKFT